MKAWLVYVLSNNEADSIISHISMRNINNSYIC